uniref:Uncharacterized protein n=1 Tax=Alexandrium monilatum TaxID=311494 RepID=A0A7S4Q4E0_9DINO
MDMKKVYDISSNSMIAKKNQRLCSEPLLRSQQLQPGDVVEVVNGRTDRFEIFKELREANELHFAVHRPGRVGDGGDIQPDVHGGPLPSWDGPASEAKMYEGHGAEDSTGGSSTGTGSSTSEAEEQPRRWIRYLFTQESGETRYWWGCVEDPSAAFLEDAGIWHKTVKTIDGCSRAVWSGPDAAFWEDTGFELSYRELNS